jgi:hypothetical protein
MKSSWEAKPQNRPTFAELVISCSSLLGNMADYVKLSLAEDRNGQTITVL